MIAESNISVVWNLDKHSVNYYTLFNESILTYKELDDSAVTAVTGHYTNLFNGLASDGTSVALVTSVTFPGSLGTLMPLSSHSFAHSSGDTLHSRGPNFCSKIARASLSFGNFHLDPVLV